MQARGSDERKASAPCTYALPIPSHARQTKQTLTRHLPTSSRISTRRIIGIPIRFAVVAVREPRIVPGMRLLALPVLASFAPQPVVPCVSALVTFPLHEDSAFAGPDASHLGAARGAI